MVIAVDFDGTLVENGDYPLARNPIIKNIQYIKKMKSEGHKIILWTCREKESLENAIKFCDYYLLWILRNILIRLVFLLRLINLLYLY